MRAITITESGGPEVLVDVTATAVNRADLLQRQGHYPPLPSGADFVTAGPDGKAAICAIVTERVWPMIGDGRGRPITHATLPLGQAAEAHRMMEAGGIHGKIVLTTRRLNHTTRR